MKYKNIQHTQKRGGRKGGTERKENDGTNGKQIVTWYT